MSSLVELTLQWLGENEDTFIYHPIIRVEGKDRLTIRFEGLIQELEILVSNDGQANLLFHLSGTDYIDILNDFDCNIEKQDEGGFYCTLCLEPTLYKTTAELWRVHTLEPMRGWINGRNMDDVVRLYYRRNRFFEASLCKLTEVEYPYQLYLSIFDH